MCGLTYMKLSEKIDVSPRIDSYVLQVHLIANLIIKELHSQNIHQWINQYIKLYFESFNSLSGSFLFYELILNLIKFTIIMV